MIFKKNKHFKTRYLPKLKSSLETIKFKSSFKLVAKKSGYLNNRQIESARQTIRRCLKRKGLLYNLAFFNINTTKKSTGARMGKGKGKITNDFLSKIKAGKTIFKLIGISSKESISALKAGSTKLPISLKIKHSDD
uniref:ribosomal protein L16 n=1 Tax=Dictyotopsis propagulifera TaxID=670095 RepID=UPI002E793420|nr:ribosomal protein L16 [Dictyotopsis propagulifera]WBP69951.1 ribosomal protein L16 [Dictyotopsis propagulifera]